VAAEPDVGGLDYGRRYPLAFATTEVAEGFRARFVPDRTAEDDRAEGVSSTS